MARRAVSAGKQSKSRKLIVSGKGHKSQFRTLSENKLPADVRAALRSKKGPTEFKNKENELPDPQQGYEYREFDVGQAHAGDAQPRGKRRLVLEIHKSTGRVGEKYFSDTHYTRGTFFRIR
jgi:ribonuclease